jgi:hypothetical protein
MTFLAGRLASLVIAIAVAVLTSALYLRDLGVPPPTARESELTTEASALRARGGRDVEGRLYPLFWHGREDRWFAPVPLYAVAAGQELFEPATGSRVASAVCGAVSAVLFYVLVRRTFESVGLAFVATVLLLLTPAYVTFSRSATHDGIWEVPIVATWLLALGSALAARIERFSGAIALCAATVMACVYSQPSGALTMVVLTAMTLGVLRPASRWTWSTLAPAGAAVALLSLPLLLWFALHPSAYANTLGQWLLHPAHIRNPVEWARALVNWNTLSLTAKTYWDFFSPSHLLASDTAPALAGVFVFPVGVLIAVGAREVLRSSERRQAAPVIVRVALLGFIGLPLVAAAFKEPRAIERALAVVPMGILLAAHGLQTWWRGGVSRRALAIIVVSTAVIQSLLWYAAYVSAPGAR